MPSIVFVNAASLSGAALVAAAVITTAGCASRKADLAQASISTKAPFSRTFQGSGDTVCWSVKRALLSQATCSIGPTSRAF